MPSALVDLMSLVLHWPSALTPKVAPIIDGWSPEEAEAAEKWASAVHLRASDNNSVRVPQEPEHVWQLRRSILIWRGDTTDHCKRMPEMLPEPTR